MPTLQDKKDFVRCIKEVASLINISAGDSILSKVDSISSEQWDSLFLFFQNNLSFSLTDLLFMVFFKAINESVTLKEMGILHLDSALPKPYQNYKLCKFRYLSDSSTPLVELTGMIRRLKFPRAFAVAEGAFASAHVVAQSSHHINSQASPQQASPATAAPAMALAAPEPFLGVDAVMRPMIPIISATLMRYFGVTQTQVNALTGADWQSLSVCLDIDCSEKLMLEESLLRVCLESIVLIAGKIVGMEQNDHFVALKQSVQEFGKAMQTRHFAPALIDSRVGAEMVKLHALSPSLRTICIPDTHTQRPSFSCATLFSSHDAQAFVAVMHIRRIQARCTVLHMQISLELDSLRTQQADEARLSPSDLSKLQAQIRALEQAHHVVNVIIEAINSASGGNTPSGYAAQLREVAENLKKNYPGFLSMGFFKSSVGRLVDRMVEYADQIDRDAKLSAAPVAGPHY